MADRTNIEWTDASWNIITGCTVLTPGCTNCYAMRLAGSRMKHHQSRSGLTKISKTGPVWTGEVRFNEQWLDQPLRWRRPRRIFVCAHGDLFYEAVPDEWIDRIFAVMALCPQHVFQVLTKRTERMRDYAADVSVYSAPGRIGRYLHALAGAHGIDAFKLWQAQDRLISWPLPNVWLGVSVEDQVRATERIPLLLDTPAAIRWVSAEPLLSSIDFERGGFSLIRPIKSPTGKRYPGFNWCVIGGESGPRARPFKIEWARSIIRQCKAAGTPVFMKQVGTKPYADLPRTADHSDSYEWLMLRDRKGGDINEWPQDIRIREYP